MTPLVRAVVAGARHAAPLRFVSDDRPRCTTNAALFREARSVAAGLRRLGVAPGSVVVCQLPSWAEGVVVLRACVLLGAVFCPVVPVATPSELAEIVIRSGAAVVVTAATWRGRDRSEHVHALDGVPVVVVGEGPSGTVAWDALVASVPDDAVAPEDGGFLLFTSGATGAPKGVRHSHATMLAEVGDASLAPSLHVLPPGHVADLLTSLKAAIHGTPMVVLDRWDPERALALIEQHRIISTSLTPYHLRQLVDAAGCSDTSSLASVLVGAAGVPPHLVEEADRLGWPAFRCYGSTEHPSVTASSPTDALAARAGTDGTPLAGNRVRIVDDTLTEVAPGEEGEVLTSGPELALGYLDTADDAGVFLPGRWYRTGDIGRLDVDGRLVITDRAKDLIIRGGENIAAKEVEDALTRHPAVAEVAVVAFPDPAYGERPCAFVVTRPGTTVTLDDLRRCTASAGLAAHKAPEDMRLVDTLPRTATGKVRKPDLRAMLR